jgi:hypothetical protein
MRSEMPNQRPDYSGTASISDQHASRSRNQIFADASCDPGLVVGIVKHGAPSIGSHNAGGPGGKIPQ